MLNPISAAFKKAKAENRPAVVPPITLTVAKTTTHVNEPITTGNRTVKS